MGRTIICGANARRLGVVTNAEDAVLIVLRGGKDGGGMFVTKGGFKLAGG